MRTLTESEVLEVSGGSLGEEDRPTRHKIEGIAALGMAGAIGTATWGVGWGAVAVGTAFAAAPVAVIAMAGLAGYGIYSWVRSVRG